jgi:hypothetical protein
MTNDVALPEWAKNGKMAGAFAGLDPSNDTLSAGVGQGYAVIGYRMSKWSLRYRGAKHLFLAEDKKTLSPVLDVVILGCPAELSKTYYKAGGVAPEGEPPLCSSMNGITPDAGVPQKQAEHCSLCPRNVWKTQENGRKGRECRDGKRLAVLIMQPYTERLLGTPLMEPALLRVPPDSLKSLAKLGEDMGIRRGFHHASYITRLSFDPEKEHTSILFNALEPVDEDSAPVILDMMKGPDIERIMYGRGARAVAQPDLAVLSPPKPVPIVPRAAPVTILDKSGDEQRILTGRRAATAAPVTIEDVGKPEEADTSMDARVKAFLAAQ